MINDEKIKQDWDIYWNSKASKGNNNRLYDKVASFYRKNIIKRILNYHIFKYIPKGSKVLHAGCGSGQVDEDIINYLKLTALDISPNAIRIYKQYNGEKAETVLASIFNLPFEDSSFDAIYNLGVMEHFTETEINLILIEFKRVLKDGGRLVILWPPEFGLSVFALDCIHFVLNKILRQSIKLHPDEISRIKSRKHAISFFEKSGFKVLNYYFGYMDFYTQCVIVAEK
ncbi:MAG: class I SAM-dependent methyltransferase [Sphingobacteriaceae bacterium]|nr:class I SAM-dependent methyltransferase [Sphingobacteriaceae bacterium]